jgi:chromosome segregation ATPase
MGVVYGFFSGAFNTLRQEKLESPASNQVSLKEEIDAIKKENTRLQAQLVEVTNQKGAAEARLGEAQNQNTGLVADAKDVKIARNLVAQLETAKSERDKKLIQLEQELRELEKALTNEKDVKKQMNAELSSRQKAIADLQKLIETVRAEQLKLETEMQNAQRENIRLQSRFRELKAAKPPPPPVSFDTDGAGPDPARVIDFVIKKKSQ